jgi:hypothetical protein
MLLMQCGAPPPASEDASTTDNRPAIRPLSLSCDMSDQRSFDHSNACLFGQLASHSRFVRAKSVSIGSCTCSEPAIEKLRDDGAILLTPLLVFL